MYVRSVDKAILADLVIDVSKRKYNSYRQTRDFINIIGVNDF